MTQFDNPDLVLGSDGLVRPVWAASDPLLRDYYDQEWGTPVYDEQGLFEKISLEVFQSGLSWVTILRKRPGFRRAFAGFDPDEVAKFSETDVDRLMNDESIVRNRAKILATINNAKATIDLREQGGLAELVWSFKPDQTPVPTRMAEVPTQSVESAALAKALKQHGFKFVGPTTMYALMESIGMVDTNLIGSHRRGTGIWPAD